jgi:hypothetical protein
VEKDSPYYAAALYYSGLSLGTPEEKDRHFRNSSEASDNSTEALYASAMVRIKHGFLYAAWPAITELKKQDRTQVLYLSALSAVYRKKGGPRTPCGPPKNSGTRPSLPCAFTIPP